MKVKCSSCNGLGYFPDPHGCICPDCNGSGILNLRNLLTRTQATALIKLLDNCRKYDGGMCRLCGHDICMIDCKMAVLEQNGILREENNQQEE